MKNIRLVESCPQKEGKTANITITIEMDDGTIITKTVWATKEYWAAKMDGMITIIDVLNKLQTSHEKSNG